MNNSSNLRNNKPWDLEAGNMLNNDKMIICMWFALENHPPGFGGNPTEAQQNFIDLRVTLKQKFTVTENNNRF